MATVGLEQLARELRIKRHDVWSRRVPRDFDEVQVKHRLLRPKNLPLRQNALGERPHPHLLGDDQRGPQINGPVL